MINNEIKNRHSVKSMRGWTTFGPLPCKGIPVFCGHCLRSRLDSFVQVTCHTLLWRFRPSGVARHAVFHMGPLRPGLASLLDHCVMSQPVAPASALLELTLASGKVIELIFFIKAGQKFAITKMAQRRAVVSLGAALKPPPERYQFCQSYSCS